MKVAEKTTCHAVIGTGKHHPALIYWDKNHPTLRNYWGCCVCGEPLKKEKTSGR